MVAAKKEGSVVIYTSIGGEAHVALVKAFKATFGMQAEWVTARADVTTEGLDPARIPEPGVEYFNGDDEDFVLREPEFSKAAQQIFGAFIH